MFKDFIGKKVIIRAARAGVFYGTLTDKKGDEVLLSNARRLWYWNGAASLSQMAAEGVKVPEDCKFTQAVEQIGILGVIEIIPVTDVAAVNIEGVEVWRSE